jgi:hypothetical protein
VFPFRRTLGPLAALLATTAAACAPAAGPAAPSAVPTAAVASPALSASPAVPVPSTSPIAVASPDAGTAFASERYGYRLTMPPGWTVTETPGTGGLHPDEPGVDTFRDTLGHILSVTRDPAPSLAAWTCPIARHLEGDHGLAVESTEDVVVAGLPAKRLQYHLKIDPYVVHYLTTELVADGRGMTLSLESTTGRDDEDRQLLDGILASVELTSG